jgi:ribosome-associated translation inhibitor RaiA
LLNKAESVIEKELRRFSEKKSSRKRSKMSKKACAP